MAGYKIYSIVFIVLSLPLFAMHHTQQNEDLHSAKKHIYLGIWQIVIGLSENKQIWYESGLEAINRHKSYLGHISYTDLNVTFNIERLFLKGLVIKGETELLKHFLAMHERTYPDSPEGINFYYHAHDQKAYTLYDVAESVCLNAIANRKPTVSAQAVLEEVLGAGGDRYENIITKHDGLELLLGRIHTP